MLMLVEAMCSKSLIAWLEHSLTLYHATGSLTYQLTLDCHQVSTTLPSPRSCMEISMCVCVGSMCVCVWGVCVCVGSVCVGGYYGVVLLFMR